MILSARHYRAWSRAALFRDSRFREDQDHSRADIGRGLSPNRSDPESGMSTLSVILIAVALKKNLDTILRFVI
jgi:hypothetical protein